MGSDPVVADDGALGVYVMAYSPLGSGSIFSDPLVTKIGASHHKSSAQVALRWIVQRNVTIATQSTNSDHLKEDAAIFDFSLSDDEMSPGHQSPGRRGGCPGSTPIRPVPVLQDFDQ